MDAELNAVLASDDFIVVVVVPMKRGKSKTVHFRASRYPRPARGWRAADFQEMAAATCDKWLIAGEAKITHVHVCTE